MEFLISPFKGGTWKIDKALFINELKKKYPTAEISEIKNDKRQYCYEWRIYNGNFYDFYMEGMLDKDLDCVTLSTNSLKSGGGEFALWARKFMPSNETIIIYDENYENHMTIDDKTTVDEIVNVFGFFSLKTSKRHIQASKINRRI